MPSPPIPMQLLYEQFNRLIDKPLEFNQLLSSLWADIYQLLAASQITWIDGIPFILDQSRGIMVSIGKQIYSAGYYGNNICDRYLKVGSVVTMGGDGIPVPRDAVITGLTAKSRSTGNWNIEIRKNGIPITLVSVPVVSSIGGDMQLDVHVDAGDWLQFYVNGTGVEHPLAFLELAWRVGP